MDFKERSMQATPPLVEQRKGALVLEAEAAMASICKRTP